MNAKHIPAPQEIGSPLPQSDLSHIVKSIVWMIVGLVLLALVYYVFTFSWLKPAFKKYQHPRPAIQSTR